MGIKQKILAGTAVSSSIIIVVGILIVNPPIIAIGGIGLGLSIRKRLFFKKKKKKTEQIQLLEPGQDQ